MAFSEPDELQIQAWQTLLEQGILLEHIPEHPHLEFWVREGNQFEKTGEWLALPDFTEQDLPLTHLFFASSLWTDLNGNVLVRASGFPSEQTFQGVFQSGMLEMLMGHTLSLPLLYRYGPDTTDPAFLESERLVLVLDAGQQPENALAGLRKMTGAELVQQASLQTQKDLALLPHLTLSEQDVPVCGWQVHVRDRHQSLLFQTTSWFLHLKSLPTGWTQTPHDLVNDPSTFSSLTDPEGEVLLVPVGSTQANLPSRPQLVLKRGVLETLLDTALALATKTPDPLPATPIPLQETLRLWLQGLEAKEDCTRFMNQLKEHRQQFLLHQPVLAKHFYLPMPEVRRLAQGLLMHPLALKQHLIQQCLMACIWQETQKNVHLNGDGLQQLRQEALELHLGSLNLMVWPLGWAASASRWVGGILPSAGYLVGMVSSMGDFMWDDPELLLVLFVEVNGQCHPVIVQVKLDQMVGDVYFAGVPLLESALRSQGFSNTLARVPDAASALMHELVQEWLHSNLENPSNLS